MICTEILVFKVMKKVIYMSFIFSFLLISCNSKTSNEKKTDSNKKQKEMIKENKTGAICPVLYKELESLIAYNDSASKKDKFSINIYIVFFSKKADGCYITISTTHFYDSHYLIGYIMINNKMISFYNPENECNNGLIDVVKLEKEKPEGFIDENSEQANDIYEPNGRKYKIHSKDSLELVYSGFL